MKRYFIFALFILYTIGFGIWVNKAFAFTYHSDYQKNYDGDTITLAMLIYPQLIKVTNVRLLGIDTPEIRGKCDTEKVLATEAKQMVHDLLSHADVLIVTVHDIDKYGRPLVDIEYDGSDLASDLVEMGYARKYDGGTRLGWCGDDV